MENCWVSGLWPLCVGLWPLIFIRSANTEHHTTTIIFWRQQDAYQSSLHCVWRGSLTLLDVGSAILEHRRVHKMYLKISVKYKQQFTVAMSAESMHSQ
jgi:hypothetical protein